ncbi:hypothetical protein HNR23_000678 [Nocardiopsis mwathae]|uniref:Protein kinase domain-containing protein n=1 Tax=Nocardiopsis mwathae TaxID=1472723 RepID=A0A7W9YEC1_9ACTN|nr:serine/threonine-protein kinase [Nocardiopsis mwathae]MBB6170618.1 hypothetical protein [Nocardiopsis mwathae]
MTDTPPTHFAPLLDDDPRQIGPYQPVGRIGAGGMGAVFAARAVAPASADEYVAVKVVRDELATNPEFRARFAREVDLVSRVHSPCVPRFLGADTAAPTPWLATAFVPGPTLRDYVRRNGPLTGGKLLGLAAGLAEALQAVHAAGIVHRDLKPGNIILSPSGPKVLDFGIARALEETALTRTGGVVGTAGWMSPEQYSGGEAALTDRSDMFSWGALVAYAATGREPFGTGPTDALAYRVRQAAPDVDGLPGELRPLVQAALAKDPGARPSAVDAVRAVEALWGASRDPNFAPASDSADAVTRLLSSEWTGMEAAPPKPPRASRRVPLLIGAAAGALLLVASAAGAAHVAGVAPWTAASGEPGADPGTAAPSPGGDADGAEGSAGGEGGGGGDAEDGGAGAADGDDAGPPPEAVDSVEANGQSARAEVGSAHGKLAIFTTHVQITTTVVSAYDMTPGDAGMSFTFSAQSEGVRQQAPPVDQDAFYVVANGEKILPEGEYSYTPDPNVPQGQEQNASTLTFPGAPETGLLVYQSPETAYGTLPAVALCYDLSLGQGGYFTPNYDICT